MSTADIRALLSEFQAGYTRRDLASLDAFLDLFVEDPEVEVIGTGAVRPGEEEWCLGRAQVRQLVEGDWQGWGDLALDLDQTRVHCLGDVGWLATSGTVTMVLTADRLWKGILRYAKHLIEQEGLDEKAKSLELMRLATANLVEIHEGERFIWPIRFTAVAVRQADRWRFHQMQFSFATTRVPDVRLPDQPA